MPRLRRDALPRAQDSKPIGTTRVPSLGRRNSVTTAARRGIDSSANHLCRASQVQLVSTFIAEWRFVTKPGFIVAVDDVTARMVGRWLSTPSVLSLRTRRHNGAWHESICPAIYSTCRGVATRFSSRPERTATTMRQVKPSSAFSATNSGSTDATRCAKTPRASKNASSPRGSPRHRSRRH